MRKMWFVVIIVLCLGAWLLVSCKAGVGNREYHYNQKSTIIYNTTTGEPIQVLDADGQYIGVNAASASLLATHGLIRIDGKVVPIGE